MTINTDMQKKYGRVGVLYGGTSSERQVSLNSGAAVAASLKRSGVDIHELDMTAGAISQLDALALDRVFIVLHGPGGEDGTLQGALEQLQLPYTGSGVLASALAMDKMRTKQLWAGMGLATPQFSSLDKNTPWQEVMDVLGGEVMVKPAREGSSIGMARVSNAADLEQAWSHAAELDDSVIAEQWVSGAEYTVAILGDEVLPPIKLETDSHFYDFHAKYEANTTRYLCPCGLSDEKQSELQQLAKQAFDAVGCRGWGRVDVMANGQGDFFLLEVNTVPGMTDHSLVPRAAKAAGYSFDALVLKVLDLSLGWSA